MQRSKILGLALMATFVLSAVVSATASAEPAVILPETAQLFSGESSKGTLEVLPGGLAHRVVCQKDKSEGNIETGGKLGQFHIKFESCKAAGLFACTGLGEAVEVILSLGTYHIVYDKLGTGAALGVGILFLVEPVHFTCSNGAEFVVQGEVLCLIKPINALAKHFEIVCERGGTEGDPGEITYWNENGTEVKMGLEKLLTKENGGAGVMSSELTTALILTEKEVLIMG